MHGRQVLGFIAQASEFDQEGWTVRERHIAVRRMTLMAIIKVIDQSLMQVVSDRPR